VDARPAIWPVPVAYVAAFVAVFVADLIVLRVASALLAHAPPNALPNEIARAWTEAAQGFVTSPAGLSAVAFTNALVMLAVALVATRLGGMRARDRLRLGPTRATPFSGTAAIVGFTGLSVACGATGDLLGWSHSGVMADMSRALAHPGLGEFVASLASIALMAGIGEEIFFRGFVQTRLAERWGTWPAIGVTALAFGIIHIDPVQGLFAFVSGIYLGWMAETFGGVRPGIVAHTVNNAMFVVWAAYLPELESRGAQLAALGVGLVLAAAGALVVRHASPDHSLANSPG
jgi:membrane protease YdiL (CAAX protease family)